ncbi:hypothetical protein GCM10022243_12650 [Saccharothrix violaceirubra]|uniref:Uncharacterized protein n=1 Tax=Saccharothrix violaceirubra TaxID=413306 RepID=A0A7W7WZF5_9PSEU|nr:hypothetical protein [Saccharothrix violaceirubra]MBB4968763.1 hypothetical protein [Saccharothrix violaceirubra]
MSTDPEKPAGDASAPSAPDAEPAAQAAAEPAGDQAPPAAEPAKPYTYVSGEDEPETPARAGGGGGTLKKVLIAVVALIVVVGAVFAVRQLSGPGRAEAGDCVSVGEVNDDNVAKVDVLGCDDQKAAYKVGKALAGAEASCPEEGLGSYHEVVADASDAADRAKLCLLPNVSAGNCYKANDLGDYVKSECTGMETFRVTKVVEGSTTTETCEDGSGMSFPEPAVTFCLEPVE